MFAVVVAVGVVGVFVVIDRLCFVVVNNTVEGSTPNVTTGEVRIALVWIDAPLSPPSHVVAYSVNRRRLKRSK